MGLDMYLSASRFLPGYEHNGPAARNKLEQALDAVGFDLAWLSSQSPTATVTATIGYWRKANAIHAWLVREVQDGVDECQETLVDRSDLRRLRELCVAALEAFKLDENYAADMRDTVEIIDRALSMPEDWTFTYRASW